MSRILDGIAAVVPRVQALGCDVHFVQPLSVSSWRQNSLRSVSEKMMKAVVNGCAWGLRDSQGSLLSRSWQVLTTSPDMQRVLNHRICDKKHKHGRLSDLSSESSSQISAIPVSVLGETVSWERQLVFRFGHSGTSAFPMNTSDHSFLLPPVTKQRLRWKTQRQKWKLIVRLMCHRQRCHHLHCHRQRHLLLMRIHLSENRSPIGCKIFINRLDTVTIAPW